MKSELPFHGVYAPQQREVYPGVRKAIGWALCEYAKVEPDEVRRYLRQCEDALSPLSRRQALKTWIGR